MATPLASRRTRLREWRAQQRLQARFRNTIQRGIGRELARHGRAAAAAYAASPEGFDVGRATDGLETGVRKVLFRAYRGVFEAFGGRVREQAEKAGLRPTVKDADTLFQRRIDDYLDEVGGRRITQISDTTRRQIVGAIRRGETAGDPLSSIRASIRGVTGGAIGRQRASVIARTETHSAANAAQEAMFEAQGLDGALRVWISGDDTRTRASHSAADGQKRPEGEPFSVGGVALRFPGDPQGPGREIINCRCALGVARDDGAEGIAQPPVGVIEPDAVAKAERAARREVLKKGRATGVEHLVVFDESDPRARLRNTTGEKDRVGFGTEILALLVDPDRRVIAHHNHPSGSSLSAADVQCIGHYPGLKRIVANGHNGAVYAAESVLSASEASGYHLRDAYDRVRAAAQVIVQREFSAGSIEYTSELTALHWSLTTHAAMLALHKQGLVKYTYRLTAAQRRALKDHADLYDEVQSAAEDAL